MILNRQAIRNRDHLRHAKDFPLPQMGPDVSVRLRPAPASLALAAMNEPDNLKQMAMFAAACMVDETGERLYSTSPEDLAEIADEFPLSVLSAIVTASTDVSTPTADAEQAAKN